MPTRRARITPPEGMPMTAQTLTSDRLAMQKPVAQVVDVSKTYGRGAQAVHALRNVTAVLKALRQNGLEVVAIHHHMLDTQPGVIFVHYWGTGPADKLATGFKAALDQLGKPRVSR